MIEPSCCAKAVIGATVNGNHANGDACGDKVRNEVVGRVLG